MDDNRLEQFIATKRAYDDMPQKKEFVIPTRTRHIIEPFMKEHDLLKDVRFFPYTIDHEGFNPTKALNIGVREAKYENLILTGPEVKPTTDLLAQLSEVPDKNIVCQTFDQDPEGNLTTLVCQGYRDKTPQCYFLAQFQKKDVEKINGWDEAFLDGYAYEDNDFGARWVRAGIPFEIRDDITATHQYHPRSETIQGGLDRNKKIFEYNNERGIVRCEKGLVDDTIPDNIGSR
jgi:hypothetical protein